MRIPSSGKYGYRFMLAMISFIVLLPTCISPFDPGIEGEKGILVVDGSIIKGRETQVIMISQTSPVSHPVFMPVENCDVKILDNNGNEFLFDETSPGKYEAKIDDAWLNIDSQFKLVFTTSSGESYESDYQDLLETAPVDSLYDIPEYRYSSANGGESISGEQFYVDLDAPEDASRYYRWVLEETYEIRARQEMIWGVFDGQSIKPFYPGDSLYRCWVTGDVTGLYSASTVNLSENSIKKIPLYFIAGNSSELNYKYRITVNQYALNKDAFEYWNQKEKELNESGNIYTLQPSQSKSNIHNINNPQELVVGFFWVASASVKRLFVKAHSRPSEDFVSCSYVSVYSESEDFNEIATRVYDALSAFAGQLPPPPVYIGVEHNTNYNIVLTPPCADCRELGGSVHKPEFWDQDQ